jgi:hypothetical protein
MCIKYGIKYDAVEIGPHESVGMRTIYQIGTVLTYYWMDIDNNKNPFVRIAIIGSLIYDDISQSYDYTSVYGICNWSRLDYDDKLTLYYKYSMKRDNMYKYNIYLSLPYLNKYLNDDDFNNFIDSIDDNFSFMVGNDWELAPEFRQE